MASLKQRFLINNLATAANITASSQGAGQIRQPKKTGTGTATMTPSGSYIGAATLLYTVQCDAAGSVDGAATIRWKTSATAAGSWEASGVSAVSTSITLSNGVSITFSAGTLVLNDKWQFPVYAEYGPGKLFVNDRDAYWKSGTLTNLVSNGGFDSTTTGWTAANCTLASVAGGQSGNCLEITMTAGVQQYAWQAITCVVGERYRVSAYVKSGSSGDEAVRISIGSIGSIVDSTTTAAWTKLTAFFTATATSHNINLVKNTATAGTMLFDTVTYRQVPSLEIDLGSAQQVTAIALLDHNLSSAAIVTVAFHTSDSWASPAATETLLNGEDTDPAIAYIDQTYRYIKWFFDDVDNTNGYISIGKLYCGTYTEVSDGELFGGANFDTANTIRRIKTSNESAAGKENFHVYSERHEFPLVYTFLTSTELATLKTVWDACAVLSTGQMSCIFLHYWYGTDATLYYMYCVSDWSPPRVRGGFQLTLEWRESVMTRTP